MKKPYNKEQIEKELKKCPLCGSHKLYLGEYNELQEESSNFGYAGEKLECLQCSVKIEKWRDEYGSPDSWTEYDNDKIEKARQELIKAWNTRA